MNKPFLLIVGECYYPCSGTGDWIACFATEEAAISHHQSMEKKYDWYRIVDLRDWAQ